MAQRTAATLPAFYRIFFPTIDPLIALGGGAYFSLFSPDTMITSLFPASHPWSTITPSHTMLLQQLGGAFLMIGFLQVFMLRYSQDINIWKLLQFGILIEDFVMFYCYYAGLGAQDRLDVDKIRWEEWGSLAITAFVAIARILFLAEVGFPKANATMKKGK